MIETVTRKRIEILADKALVKRVTEAIDKAEITGWTIVPVTSGKGRDGQWRQESVMGTDKVFVLTIAAEDRAMALAEQLAPMLTNLGFIFNMWDVEVIRGERF
ncbi:P-II family nitrogen regulator [Erythrobacter sp. Alg231-14]|uniref:P-II family nitrogen regulator n=1 Tax=Erythrobacter sp. Alg231-14 TaxID=1922225 RepID=UPI000D554740